MRQACGQRQEVLEGDGKVGLLPGIERQPSAADEEVELLSGHGRGRQARRRSGRGLRHWRRDAARGPGGSCH